MGHWTNGEETLEFPDGTPEHILSRLGWTNIKGGGDPTSQGEEVPADGGPGEPEPDDGDSPDDGYESFSNEELREMLHERELSTTGKKAELIARLREDDQQG